MLGYFKIYPREEKRRKKKIDELVSRGIKNLMKDASDFGCDLFVTYVCNHFLFFFSKLTKKKKDLCLIKRAFNHNISNRM